MLPVLLVGVPVADTLVSILRRAISKLENGASNGVHHADRNHIHHRLLALGLSHRMAVLVLYGAGALLSGVALLSLLMTRQQTGLLLLGLLLAGFLGLQRLGYGEFALIKRGVALRVYDLPMMRRAFFVVFVDIALICLALYVSAALKLDSWTLTGHRPIVIQALTVLVPTQVILLSLFGVYRGTWRLAGVHEFLWLGAAVLSAAAVGVVLSAALGFTLVPPAVFVIYGFVALTVTAASRASYRALDQIRERSVELGTPTLLYGAGKGGSTALADLYENDRVYSHSVGSDVSTMTLSGGGGLTSGDTYFSISGPRWSAAMCLRCRCYAVHPETKVAYAHLQQFVGTAVSGSAYTVSPTPTASGAKQNVNAMPVSAAAVTAIGTASTAYRQPLMYHKDFFTFVTADLPLMDDAHKCTRLTKDGLSLRVWQASDIRNDELLMRVDILYGFKILRPEWACRMIGSASA